MRDETFMALVKLLERNIRLNQYKLAIRHALMLEYRGFTVPETMQIYVQHAATRCNPAEIDFIERTVRDWSEMVSGRYAGQSQ